MPRYRLSASTSSEPTEFEAALALAAEGSKACRSKVEVRPFHTQRSIAALLDP